MIDNPDLADVEFITGNTTYRAHRLVLCSASDFFRRLFGIERVLKLESLGGECPGWTRKRLQKIAPEAVNLGMVEGLESYSVM